MKKIILLPLAVAVLISFRKGDKKEFHWKNGAKAAICLTYDDGMQTHITNAIPQLDSVGMKGTFFINAPTGSSSVIGWKKAARNGHELGNHSLFHPCPRSIGWDEEIATENYSIPQMLKEIKTVNMILENLDPNRKTFSYAYPCNHTEVGGQSYIDALKKSNLVNYARGGSGEKKVITPNFKDLNKMQVHSWAVPEDTGLQELIDYAEKAREKGGLAVFQFHGIGGQWLSISNETHQGLLKYLSENRSDYWIASFSEIVMYIEKNK